ncbi:MAG: hypothetical protein J0H18_18425 [Rhizobiales bacterium]|nr:hypothetical protein [Hyphomicrobiales bacterium]OJY04822.1 MAG: hypothetical protein BGP07_08930 [Rhizobiales bacterium 63-22]
MKHPLRSVIVEYKGRRSRNTNKPNALWGDLDLKAIAREVKEEILPRDMAVPEITSSDAIPGTVKEVSPAELAPSVDATMIDVHRDKARPSSATEPVQKLADMEIGASKTIRKQSVRPTRRLRKSGIGTSPIVSTSPHAMSPTDGELDALETENAELKRRLASHLRRENAQLARMLARTDRALGKLA